MSLFEQQIKEIQRGPKNKIFINNDSLIQEIFKRKADNYIVDICNNIREEIKERAKNQSICYDDKSRIFRSKAKKYNPHYRASWESAFEIHFDKSIFEKAKIIDPYVDYTKTYDGFAVNDDIIIKYLFNEIYKNLSKDGIYPIYFSYSNRHDQKTTIMRNLPDEHFWNKYNEYIRNYKTSFSNQSVYILTFCFFFGYFLK